MGEKNSIGCKFFYVSSSIVPFRFSKLTALLFSGGGFVLVLIFMPFNVTQMNGGFLLIQIRCNQNCQYKMYCMLEYEGQCPDTFPEQRWMKDIL